MLSRVKHVLRFRLSTIFLLMIPCAIGFLWLSTFLNDRPIDWVDFSEAALKEHVDNKQTVLVFFTADWDATSRVVEQISINTRRVKQLVRSRDVIAMRADCTNQLASKDVLAALTSFDLVSTPLIVVYPPDFTDKPIILDGFVLEHQIIDALTPDTRVDFFTRVSIWLALVFYAVAVVLLSRSRTDGAKWAWSVGCLFYLIHVFCAFQVHYLWSHEIAKTTTALQTEELTGIKTAVGIYVNYLFTMVWIVDAAWWGWVGSERYSNRGTWISTLLHLFFVFMIFNGAVVFAHGPARWIGAGVLLVVIANWTSTRLTSRRNTT